MLKICHLTNVHPPLDTRIFQKECKTLAINQFEVVLIVPHSQDELIAGVRIRALLPVSGRIGRIFLTSWRVFKVALEEDADLYHVHDPELLPWAQLLRLFGKKVIFDMHENFPKSILTKSWLKPLMRPFFARCINFAEGFLLRNLPIIFAENSYRKDYPWINCSVVVQNMPEIDCFANLAETKYEVPTIGYIGAVTLERGSIVVLQAMQILKAQGVNVNFECIGPIRRAHKDAFIEGDWENISDQIKSRGYMPAQEGWSIINQCHIGLAILEPIPNYLESYPTKIFEYMAMGLPCIVSNFPLYKDVVERYGCGICVDPQSPEDVAAAIKRLIENKSEGFAMGQRGRAAVVEKFNWGRESEKLLKFYKKILSF